MISPERKTIEEILTGSGYTFSVPDYQRDFDWGKSELLDLLDDLKELKEDHESSLYLGTMIFDVSNREDYKIVDGQQRLTTISILLIALREHLKQINQKLQAGEMQRYITINADWSGRSGNKIVVSKSIREIFEHISESEWDGVFPDRLNGVSVKRQVSKVRPIFNEVFSQLSDYGLEETKSIIKAILQAYVVAIKVENTSDVFAIFERTNARGLDLNIGDLLKNFIFSQGDDELSAKWAEVIDNAEGSLQKMLKYFWISRNGYIAKTRLYKELKSQAKLLGVFDFIDQLHEFSRFYRAIRSDDVAIMSEWLREFGLPQLASNEDHLQEITRRLTALKFFRVTQPYSVIFSLFYTYKRTQSNSHKNLLAVLRCIENYHFVNNIISGRIGNEVERFYADQAKQMFSSTLTFPEICDEFINGLRDRLALRDEFIANFVEKVTYRDPDLIHYVFDRINNHELRGAQQVSLFQSENGIKVGNYSIEHILPVSWSPNLDVEEVDAVNEVGNLLIIPRHTNSSLGNISPLDKLEMYRDPGYVGNLAYVNDFLLTYGEKMKNWGVQSIKSRSIDIGSNGFDTVWSLK